MLAQRRRRWADVVQMLYNCFVFAGKGLVIPQSYYCVKLIFHPLNTKCLINPQIFYCVNR